MSRWIHAWPLSTIGFGVAIVVTIFLVCSAKSVLDVLPTLKDDARTNLGNLVAQMQFGLMGVVLFLMGFLILQRSVQSVSIDWSRFYARLTTFGLILILTSIAGAYTAFTYVATSFDPLLVSAVVLLFFDGILVTIVSLFVALGRP